MRQFTLLWLMALMVDVAPADDRIEFRYKVPAGILGIEKLRFYNVTVFKASDGKAFVTNRAPELIKEGADTKTLDEFKDPGGQLGTALRRLYEAKKNAESKAGGLPEKYETLWFVGRNKQLNINEDGGSFTAQLAGSSKITLAFNNFHDLKTVLGTNKASQKQKVEAKLDGTVINFKPKLTGTELAVDAPLLLYRADEGRTPNKWSEIILSWKKGTSSRRLCLPVNGVLTSGTPAVIRAFGPGKAQGVDNLQFARLKSLAYVVSVKEKLRADSRLSNDWDTFTKTSKFAWRPQNRFQNVWFGESIPESGDDVFELGPSQLAYNGLEYDDSELVLNSEQGSPPTYYPAYFDRSSVRFVLVGGDSSQPFYLQDTELTVWQLYDHAMRSVYRQYSKEEAESVLFKKAAESKIPEGTPEPAAKKIRETNELRKQKQSLESSRTAASWERLSLLPAALTRHFDKSGRLHIGVEFLYLSEILRQFRLGSDGKGDTSDGILEEHWIRHTRRVERYFELRAFAWLNFCRATYRPETINEMIRGKKPIADPPKDISDPGLWTLAGVVLEEYFKQYGGAAHFEDIARDFLRANAGGVKHHNPLDEPVVFISPVRSKLVAETMGEEKISLPSLSQFKTALARQQLPEVSDLYASEVKSERLDRRSLGQGRIIYGLNSNVSEWVCDTDETKPLYALAGSNWRDGDIGKIPAESNSFSSVAGFRLCFTPGDKPPAILAKSKEANEQINEWYKALYGSIEYETLEAHQPWREKIKAVEKALGPHEYWHEEFLRALLFAGFRNDHGAGDDSQRSETLRLMALFLRDPKHD